MEATGWQQHSVRGFLAGTVKKKLGFPLTSSKAEGELRRYRIERSAVADMTQASIDIAAELVRLEALTNFELRASGGGCITCSRPRASPAISCCAASPTKSRRGRSAASPSRSCASCPALSLTRLRPENRRAAPRATVKPGTRLVREWNGHTHTVLVHADGVEWRGTRYRSLSVVAREITGAHWSGPRFFG